MSQSPENMLTTKQAAAILGRSHWAVIRLVQSGKLVPDWRMPGKRGSFLFDRATIESFAKQDPE